MADGPHVRSTSLFRKWKQVCICGLFVCLGGAPRSFSPVPKAEASEVPTASVEQSAAVIRVSAHLVTVPVSVTDASGQAIRGLKSGDFKIAEDGNPQTISKMAEANESPLQMVLLFDLSGSLNSRFEFEQQAADRFLKKIWKDGDTACVIAFSEQPQILLRRSVFVSEITRAFSRLQPTVSSTAFFDAVVLSAHTLSQSAAPDTRQAVIALSDGADNRSRSLLSDALREVHHSNIIFYAINPSGASVRLNEVNRKGEDSLASLADATGGAAFVSDENEDLDGIFCRIASELRAQYLLGYYPSNSLLDGRFREIEVSIPGRPDLRVRARQGYYATPK
jgi:Ca-activated chloride channel family protein